MNPDLFSSQIRKILEDGALLFADPLEDAPLPEATDFHAQIRFDGGAQGVVRLDCHRGIGDQIAHNLLGLDEAVACDEALVESSLREILNILGGQLASGLATPGNIKLHTPEAIDAQPPVGEQLKSYWSIDGMPLVVTLTWNCT
jgi:hypothetical protein